MKSNLWKSETMYYPRESPNENAFKLLEKRLFFPKSDREIRNVAADMQAAGGDVAHERHLSP